MDDAIPIKKRSIFNRPSWSKPQALGNGNDLFHRSHHTYIDVAAQAEWDRRKKLAKKERERAQRAEIDGRAGKRQRISSDSDEDDEDDQSSSDDYSRKLEADESSTTDLRSKSAAQNTTTEKPLASPKSLIKRYEAECAAKKLEKERKQKPQVSNIIDLEDEEEDDAAAADGLDQPFITRAAIARPPKPSEEDDQPASDEEFPELARQARENARRKRLQENMFSGTPDPSQTARSDGDPQRSQSIENQSPPPPPVDPTVSILVTSSISNTTPLIVNRRLSQRLKEVKQAWAERQRFTPEFAEKIFLTFRGKKLFDVTSCKSLGISVDTYGNIRGRGDIWEDADGQIHVEVMTAEMLEAYRKAKNREVMEEKENLDEVLIVEKKEPGVKIICKAKDFPDFKLVVKPVSISCGFLSLIALIITHSLR